MQDEVFRAVMKALEDGEAVSLLTVVEASGSTPQRAGAKMLVYADGRSVGTIGGGYCEHDAAGKAREAIRLQQPVLARYDLTREAGGDYGAACGGHMEVFIEPVVAAPPLYVVGAGHVGQHVAHLAREVGFSVHVIDDREEYANAARFPGAAEIAVADIPAWLTQSPIPAGSYAVIVTRGHRHDLDALRVLIRRDLAYVGVIGSRAKVKTLFDALAGEGIEPDRLARVRAPIGLDIGAVTPAEIAVSIAAELIAARHGRLEAPHVAAATMRAGR
jgi:xanthine dehydrogenase accessory factor